MDDSKVLVELQLAADQFERALDQARASFQGAMGGLAKTAGVAGEQVDRAFSQLGIKSTRQLQAEIHEIDIERMVRIINGEDQMAELRDRLGI